MATIDQQFIEYIVKELVSRPEAVRVERKIDEKGVLLELTVDPEDIGRVIGKRGSTAQSLRNLLRALGSKNDARYNLKIIDVDRPDGAPVATPAADESAPSSDADTTISDEFDAAVEESTPEPVENDGDLAKKTRAELADLDDLDI
jgi:predicted RNA-binding protein YlqC (UPF0109 family)